MSFGEYLTSAYPDPCMHGAANNYNETRVRQRGRRQQEGEGHGQLQRDLPYAGPVTTGVLTYLANLKQAAKGNFPSEWYWFHLLLS